MSLIYIVIHFEGVLLIYVNCLLNNMAFKAATVTLCLLVVYLLPQDVDTAATASSPNVTTVAAKASGIHSTAPGTHISATTAAPKNSAQSVHNVVTNILFVTVITMLVTNMLSASRPSYRI
ncbi:uncharacterized protein LOC132713860 [Ruditapes philippinarum]|uniref:uncharacterized protein LOC132713860 n=1 Tax=Ruditapes philippinarum TaxID=129788 RepID=UPI00295BABF1|nr:uncharacterized protein LOC132713860 [Ruditapes philippinarum]